MFHQDAGDRRGLEGELSREHLVGHHSQTVDVGPPVDLTVSRRLLRAHVVRGTDRDAGRGERRGARRRGQRLRDPEVGDDHPAPAALEQDVVGLYVPVNDPKRVCGSQRVGRLQHDAARLVRRQLAAALELRPERLAVHIRHHEVDQPVGPLADGMDRHDMGVRQPRRRLGLAQEAQPDLLAEREIRRQHFDGDLALQALVAGVEHHAHSAPADLSLERVGGAEGPGQAGGECLVCIVHRASREVRADRLAARRRGCNL